MIKKLIIILVLFLAVPAFGGVSESLFRDGIEVGDDTNYTGVSSGGVTTFHGTAKRHLRLRPSFNVIPQIAHSKPTVVTRGVHHGYSMPVYSSDDEELFFYSIIPSRWDGVSDISVCFATSISQSEDVGDKFQFRLSWDRMTCADPVHETAVDVDVETTVLTSRNAAYDTYMVTFVIDHDAVGHEISAGDLLSWRIYRIAASASSVTGEVIVWVSSDTYETDKIFGE